MNHLGTKELETARLRLRRFVPEDAQQMYQNWASEPEVTKFLTWPPHPNADFTRKLIEQWIKEYEKSDYYNWVIELKETGEIIGNISVVSVKENIAEAMLGYCMGTKWWGKGIMPEAGRAVCKYLFEQVGFNRIGAAHDKNNPKSGRVMQKLGMTCEGTLRSAGFNNLGIVDEVLYSILKEEYSKNRVTAMKESKYLISETTKEERIEIIRTWIPADEMMDGSDIDLWDMYADYINGTKEIAECNAAFQTDYYME